MTNEVKTYTREELEDKLTDKERVFCHEYIVDWNKSRAARAAKYSENTCAEIGYENMRKPHIIQYVDFIKNDLEIESGVSKLRNLKELAKIAYSSIAALHNTWITLKDFNELTEDQTAAIESTDTKTMKVGEDGGIEIEYVKIKLYPKLTAIKLINEMMGYDAVQNINHTNAGGKFETTTNVTYNTFNDKS